MVPDCALVVAAEELVDELVDAGHEVTVADVLDCLASAGLTVVREPREAPQAYSEYILQSLERPS